MILTGTIPPLTASSILHHLCGREIIACGSPGPQGAVNRISFSLCSYCLEDSHEPITLAWFKSLGGEIDPTDPTEHRWHRLLLNTSGNYQFFLLLPFGVNEYDGGLVTTGQAKVWYCQMHAGRVDNFIITGATVHTRGDVRLLMAAHGKKTCSK